MALPRDYYFKGFSTVNINLYNGVKTWTLTDIPLIQQDLINVFYTKKGERLMLPEFGCIIWDLLFEPWTDYVRNQIISECQRIIALDTRVVLKNTNIINFEQGIRIALLLEYKPWDVIQTFALDFDRQNATT